MRGAPAPCFETDAALAPLCRDLEARAAARGTPETATLAVAVVLLPDFSTLDLQAPSPQAAALTRKNPAIFRPSENTVYVNRAVFFGSDELAQRAVLAHEVAHAARHAEGIAHDDVGDGEFETDLLACRMGFAEEVGADRGRGNPEWGEALRQWEDPAAAMQAWTRGQERRLIAWAVGKAACP